MKCVKCSGLSIFENNIWRCLNCGKRVFQDIKIIEHSSIDLFFRKQRIELNKSQAKKEANVYRNCGICGNKFPCKTTYQMYCGRACRVFADNSPKHIKEKRCLICGQPFKSKCKIRKYCGSKCYVIALNKRRSKKK